MDSLRSFGLDEIVHVWSVHLLQWMVETCSKTFHGRVFEQLWTIHYTNGRSWIRGSQQEYISKINCISVSVFVISVSAVFGPHNVSRIENEWDKVFNHIQILSFSFRFLPKTCTTRSPRFKHDPKISSSLAQEFASSHGNYMGVRWVHINIRSKVGRTKVRSKVSRQCAPAITLVSNGIHYG